MPFIINTFDVTIQLESLTCVKEFDRSGHSEPYLWTAFLFADNVTLSSPSPLGVLVPLETESGHGVFGAAGKDVRPGTVIPIPETIGRFQKRLISHHSDGPLSSEIMFAGFVGVLLEEDSTSSGAIAAGHRELGPALRDEILNFFLANNRFPNTDEINALKDTIAQRVHDTIASKVGCWSGFWSDQDDMIGVAGDENTLFIASQIRALSRKGRTPRQTSIRGSEIIFQWLQPYGSPVPVKKDHEYTLNWSIRIDPVGDLHVPTDGILEVALRLEQLDTEIGELVTKLHAAGERSKGPLRTELDEKAKRTRPRLVRELQRAWADLGQKVTKAEKKKVTSKGRA
jgi:hypothetical protein